MCFFFQIRTTLKNKAPAVITVNSITQGSNVETSDNNQYWLSQKLAHNSNSVNFVSNVQASNAEKVADAIVSIPTNTKVFNNLLSGKLAAAPIVTATCLFYTFFFIP